MRARVTKVERQKRGSRAQITLICPTSFAKRWKFAPCRTIVHPACLISPKLCDTKARAAHPRNELQRLLSVRRPRSNALYRYRADRTSSVSYPSTSLATSRHKQIMPKRNVHLQSEPNIEYIFARRPGGPRGLDFNKHLHKAELERSL